MKLDDFLQRLKNVKRYGSGYTARCPAHDDNNNSLSVSQGDDDRILLKCFAGCTIEDILRSLSLEKKDLFSYFTPPVRSARLHTNTKHTENTEIKTVQSNVQLFEYARYKKIPENFLKSLGLKDYNYQKQQAIRIPYYDKTGQEKSVQYRIALNGDCFRWRSGSKTMLYGLWRKSETVFIFLVEGASDCHTLWYHEIPAYGLPGASTYSDKRDAGAFKDFNHIYIIIEPDKGGEAVEKWLAKSSIRDRAFIVDFGKHKDPSGLYLSDPENFKSNIKRYMDQAVPWVEVEKQRRQEVLKDSWGECCELAQRPAILDEFAKLIPSCGLAGEIKAAKLLYLALVTRILPKPTSVVVDGPSAAGKSYLVENVLKFFPIESYHDLTAMSEKNLAYTEENLSHRFLILYEAAGLSGDFATYLIRSLLSEGCIKYEFVEKTSEGLKSRLIEKQGPTGLIMTTTQVWMHPENETRVLTVTVNDTQDQTSKVFMALAEDDVPPVDFKPWHALQNYLQAGHNGVAIPFAKELAGLTKPIAVRLRRDFGALLSLIRGHALLHQASRKVDPQGRIIATIEDYATVLDLVGDTIGQNVDACVPETVKETVRAAEMILETSDEEYCTIAEVGKQLNIDRASASRRINTAIRRGYLKEGEKKTRPKQIVIGDPLPGDTSIFPDPDELFNIVQSDNSVHLEVHDIFNDNSISYATSCSRAHETGDKKKEKKYDPLYNSEGQIFNEQTGLWVNP